MERKPLSNLTAAIILFLLMAVFTFVINFGGFQRNPKLSWVSYLIIILGIMVFVIKYGKDMHNNVTFGNLFAFGFKTTAILIIFFSAFTIIFYLIFPEYKANLLDIMKENILKNATDENREQMEKSLDIMKRFFWVSMIGGILITFAILGSIGSLIGAAVTKKEPHTMAGDINQIGQ